MNMQAIRAKVRIREVSERKQVGDAANLINTEPPSGKRIGSNEDEI